MSILTILKLFYSLGNFGLFFSHQFNTERQTYPHSHFREIQMSSENLVLISFERQFVVDFMFSLPGLIQSVFFFCIPTHHVRTFSDAPPSDIGWSNLGISSSRISLFWPACKAPWEAGSLSQVVSRGGIKCRSQHWAQQPQRLTACWIYSSAGPLWPQLFVASRANFSNRKHGFGGFRRGDDCGWDWGHCE